MNPVWKGNKLIASNTPDVYWEKMLHDGFLEKEFLVKHTRHLEINKLIKTIKKDRINNTTEVN